jgi:hypothetical protein
MEAGVRTEAQTAPPKSGRISFGGRVIQYIGVGLACPVGGGINASELPG